MIAVMIRNQTIRFKLLSLASSQWQLLFRFAGWRPDFLDHHPALHISLSEIHATDSLRSQERHFSLNQFQNNFFWKILIKMIETKKWKLEILNFLIKKTLSDCDSQREAFTRIVRVEVRVEQLQTANRR